MQLTGGHQLLDYLLTFTLCVELDMNMVQYLDVTTLSESYWTIPISQHWTRRENIDLSFDYVKLKELNQDTAGLFSY